MQNDFEQAEIEKMIPENHSSPPKTKFGPPTPRLWRVNKKHFFKFGIIFAVILILVTGGFYAWDNYFSPSARSARLYAPRYIIENRVVRYFSGSLFYKLRHNFQFQVLAFGGQA